MSKIVRSVFVGAVCLGLLAGCSKGELTSGLDSVMGNAKTSASTTLLTQGIASANKGDSKAAIGYLTSWYAMQSDKAAARKQLQTLATLKANLAASKTINEALSKLGN